MHWLSIKFPSSTEDVLVASSSPVEAGGDGNESQTGSRMQVGHTWLGLYDTLAGQGRVKTRRPDPSLRTALGSLQAK